MMIDYVNGQNCLSKLCFSSFYWRKKWKVR